MAPASEPLLRNLTFDRHRSATGLHRQSGFGPLIVTLSWLGCDAPLPGIVVAAVARPPLQGPRPRPA